MAGTSVAPLALSPLSPLDPSVTPLSPLGSIVPCWRSSLSRECQKQSTESTDSAMSYYKRPTTRAGREGFRPYGKQYKDHEPGRGLIWFVSGLPVPSTEPVTTTRHTNCVLVGMDRWGEKYRCVKEE